jgi:hypothetical protein
MSIIKKRCVTCKLSKGRARGFYRLAIMRDGYRNDCIKCHSKKSKAYYRLPQSKKRRRATYDPDRVRRNMLKRVYNTTPEAFDAMLMKQAGACAICRTTKPDGVGGFVVDHDHKTGAIRGLLCHSCNLMLGHIEAYARRTQGDVRAVGPVVATYLGRR